MRMFLKSAIYIVFSLPFSLLAQKDTSGINFIENLSWDEIKAKAKDENKYIFMDCYTTWCSPCKAMDKEIYPNEQLGKLFQNNFIAVKVQLDTTNKDNNEVRKWRKDAQKISSEYEITAYPTFLFFNPEGKVVYKDIGYKDVQNFSQLAKNALNPENIKYYADLEAYKKGKEQGVDLYSLANYANRIGNTNLGRQIAKNYIQKTEKRRFLEKEQILFIYKVAKEYSLADSLAGLYIKDSLNTLTSHELCRKGYIEFMSYFIDLLNSRDAIFQLYYRQASKVDSIVNRPGYSKMIVDYVVSREEIKDKLPKEKKEAVTPSDWKKIQSAIQNKYPDLNAALLIIDFKIKYYKHLSNWMEYADLLVERVEKYGPFGPIPQTDFNLNNHAWDLFEHSIDKTHLEKALEWSTRAVNIVRNSKDPSNLPSWMDTKANILYKLGRIDEALALQRKVVQLDPHTKDFKDNLEKMEKHQPTWPAKY